MDEAFGASVRNTNPKRAPYALPMQQMWKDGDYEAMETAHDDDARRAQASLDETFRPSNVYLFLRLDKEMELQSTI